MAHAGALPAVRLRPLAAAVAALFALDCARAWAAPAVTNCNDSGAGSLRASVLAAAEGDTVDATDLQCSTISLTTGYIIVVQNSLKIAGPGIDRLTIDGSQETKPYDIFFHNGTGTFEIDDLAVAYGDFYLNDQSKYFGGGCVHSNGDVILTRTSVSGCRMSAGHQSRARGGGVFAAGSLTLTDSIVSANAAYGARIDDTFYYDNSFGGGLFAKGPITLTRSVVLYNSAQTAGGIYAQGALAIYSSSLSRNNAYDSAGAKVRGSLRLDDSDVSGNFGLYSGGIRVAPLTTGRTAIVRNSTISGNQTRADESTPGLLSTVPTTISNSTIAFNSAPSGPYNAAVIAAGATLQLDSSIVAENIPQDVRTAYYTAASGADNFINTGNVTLPATIGGCPRLQPLADNGGPTRTHALRPESPAIDRGRDPAWLPYDQRGGGFARLYGAGVDIGAYEWHGEYPDALFRSGFDFGADWCDWEALLHP